MNRREAIQRTALVLGYTITGSALTGVLNGCKASPELNFQPVFFTNDQGSLISEVAEIILPKTTTPGAKDVGVPGFIDSMLKSVYTKEEQDAFVTGLTEFDADAEKSFGSKFIDCSPDEQKAHFKKHHDAAISQNSGGGSSGWWNTGSGNDKPFVLKMKELTLLGFFSSEPGATQVLQYNQVPGPYQGCVPLETVGKTWAT
jgi:gluconate 2-dehydrogenase gamma chain